MTKIIKGNPQEKLKHLIVILLLGIAFFLPLLPHIATALIILALIITIFKMLLSRTWDLKRSPIQYGVCGFFLFTFVSVFVSPIRMFSLFNWLYYIGSYAVLYYLTLSYIDTYENRKRMLMTIIIAAGVACIYGLFQYSQITGIEVKEWVDPHRFPLLRRRLFSTLDNPNLMGAYLMIVMAISCPLALLHNRVRRPWVAWLVAFFFIICVVLTYSRGIWISIAAMALYWGLTINRKLLLAFLVIPIILFFYDGGVSERLWSLVDTKDTSVSLRYAIWDSTTYMIAEHPWFGIGWGAYWVVYPSYNYFIQDAHTIIFHAHNMFLHIAAVSGLPALLFFLLVLVGHAWKAFRLRTDGRTAELVIKYGLTAMILGVLISGITDYELYSYQVSAVFWQILGLGAGVLQESKKQS